LLCNTCHFISFFALYAIIIAFGQLLVNHCKSNTLVLPGLTGHE